MIVIFSGTVKAISDRGGRVWVDGEGEAGFAGAHGAAVGAVWPGGEPDDFVGVVGGADVVVGNTAAVHGLEVPLGGVVVSGVLVFAE